MNKDENNHLIELVDNLERLKNQNLSISFKIGDIKKTGFTIKVNGLFAFISFNHMPWQYKTPSYWNYVATFLIGKRFNGKIYLVNREPIKVIIDGQDFGFPEYELQKEMPYQAIILQKTDYGLILELGAHFGWKFGSIVGLAHKSTFIDDLNFEKVTNGDCITTFFHGYTKQGKPILGELIDNFLILNGALDHYVGTIKKVRVKVIEIEKNYLFHGEKITKKRLEYFVEDKYPASLTIANDIYPGIKKEIRLIVDKFRHNEIIMCEVIGITKQKKLKLALNKEYIENLLKYNDE